MAGKLEKRRTVLKQSHEVLDHVVFGKRNEETEDLEEVLYLPSASWIDLGYPTEVTITIEPGDTLNP